MRLLGPAAQGFTELSFARQVMRSGGQTDKRAMLQRTQASSGERDVLESRDLNLKLERDREKTREGTRRTEGQQRV